MRTFKIPATAFLAAACAIALFGAAATPSPKPARGKPAATPASSPTPAPVSQDCNKAIAIGEVTLCSSDFNYNFKTGDLQFPNEVHGRTTDGTYRADRAYGNLHGEIITLVGHVVVHRDAKRDKAGKPVEPVTLTADQAHIESKAKFYRASGNARIVQGDLSLAAPLIVDDERVRTITASGGVTVVKADKTMTAPQMTLDEDTHIAHLTGGVHAQQPPSRTFDAAEVFYNTVTQDFKALGGIKMQFPANAAVPPASPSPSSKPGRPTPAPGAAPAPSKSPAPLPTPTPGSGGVRTPR